MTKKAAADPVVVSPEDDQGMSNPQGPRPGLTRRLGSQALVVLLGNVFTLLVGFPLQLFVARFLGASGLGAFGVLDGAVNTANNLLNLGIAPAVLRYLPSHLIKREYSELRRLLKLATVVTVAVGGLAYAVLLAAMPWLDSYWSHPDVKTHTILLMGLMAPIGLVLHLLMQALRGLHEIKYMVLGSSVLQLTLKAIVVLGTFYVGLRLDGYVLATVLAGAFGAAWMAFGLKRRLRGIPAEGGPVDPENLGRWSRYAVVYTGNSLVDSASAYLDRFLLAIYFSTGLVGILVVVRQLQQLPQTLNQVLLLVAAPMFVDAHAENDAAARQHLYTLMIDWVVKASLPLMLFLAIYAHDVLALFGQEFADQGTLILRILLAGQMINLATGPLGMIANMSGLEAAVFRISTIGAILNALLMFLLVPYYALYGVAVVGVFHNVFLNGAFMLMVWGRFGLRWWDRRYLSWVIPSFLSGAAGLGATYIAQHGLFALAVILMGMYALFAVAAFLQGLEEDERDLLRHLKERLLGGAAQA